MPKIAACQMVSTPDVDVNLLTAERLIQKAVDKGAQLVCLPEYFCLMGRHDQDKVALREPLGHGRLQDFLSQMAQQYQIWLVGGTIPLASQQPDKILNSTLVFDPQGMRVAQYDKIHLFSFSKAGECYDEARTIVSGATPVSFNSPWGRVGLSICYDLRFPELYRALSPLTLLLVLAAFTYTTGSAHWDVLLRARAIENQCYVLAAAQGGQHLNGRRTWGHSQLIDPWGEVLSLLPEGEGVVVSDLDLNHLKKIRENLPALSHRRLV